MPFTNLFLVSCRSISMLIVLIMGLTFKLESLPFRGIFVGLLFSHFAMGFYYSKNNVILMREKKFALLVASIILSIGLYVSFYVTYLAPYFLVVHAALSDAYLLRHKSKQESGELLAFLRTVFYCACASTAFIEMQPILLDGFLVIAFVSLVGLFFLSKDKTTLILFELPLIGIVIYSQVNQKPFHFHYMGFYHIITWYVFSFWMLFVKEKNGKKTVSFFSKIVVMSVVFIFLFNNIFGYTITDQSFLKIIGTWSILHIFSTIPLSKFNPNFLKNIFYV